MQLQTPRSPDLESYAQMSIDISHLGSGVSLPAPAVQEGANSDRANPMCRSRSRALQDVADMPGVTLGKSPQFVCEQLLFFSMRGDGEQAGGRRAADSRDDRGRQVIGGALYEYED